tara:strand:- start:14526 stop:15476 length:951 start_codon:yes stop_codon:yes gene_type:complete
MRFFPIAGILGALSLVSCTPDGPNYQPDPANPLHAGLSGEKAYAHVEAMVAMGPRPAGSQALEKNRVYLENELRAAGWEPQRQDFEAETPIGPIQFSNIRARFPDSQESSHLWDRRAYLLVGSHYDTKRYTNIHFVGANDAGSSTGLLLEMARVAASEPEFAKHLELVFFDGEEAFVNFDEKDGLYGSRHYARNLIRRLDPQLRPEYVVVLDMVGETKLSITLPADTPKFLANTLRSAADELGTRRYFGVWPTSITDDHIPFRDEGIAAIDIIDFDFKAWHTAKDTLDHVSAQSLEIVGQTSIRFLEKLLTEPPEK